MQKGENIIMILKRALSSFRARFEMIDNKINATRRLKRLNTYDFSIISNNCWGAHVYRRYGLQYSSPTIGLYFFPDDYLTFLSSFKDSIVSPLHIINAEQSKHYKLLIERNQQNVLVGKLDNGVEMVLLHYHSPQEAIEKWERRCKRINTNNLIVKFSSLDMCTKDQCDTFNSLSFEKKIMFTTFNDPKWNCNVNVNRVVRDGQLMDDTTYYSSYVDLERFINTGEIV